jgi:hypothetical protein
MKSGANTQTQKNFSVKSLDKASLKSRAFTALQTSFAIEGIRFTESQLRSMAQRTHLTK